MSTRKTRQRDRNAAPRRGLTDLPVSDRVGGGMQRSAGENGEQWLPGNCPQDFHFVKFTNGNFVCACDCLTTWYTESSDGT